MEEKEERIKPAPRPQQPERDMLSRHLDQNGEALLTPCGGGYGGSGDDNGGSGWDPRHAALPPSVPPSSPSSPSGSLLSPVFQVVSSVVPAVLDESLQVASDEELHVRSPSGVLHL